LRLCESQLCLRSLPTHRETPDILTRVASLNRYGWNSRAQTCRFTGSSRKGQRLAERWRTFRHAALTRQPFFFNRISAVA